LYNIEPIEMDARLTGSKKYKSITEKAKKPCVKFLQNLCPTGVGA
jgi:hypothetical protein